MIRLTKQIQNNWQAAILQIIQSGKDRIKMLMLEQKINVNEQELIEKQTLLTKYV